MKMVDDIKKYFKEVNSPEAMFDYETGEFELKGKSICEVAETFYKPLLDILTKYKEEPKEETKFVFKLEYFNTSSAKWILKLFYQLDEIHKVGNKLTVEWHYEEDDDDVLEAGKDFANMVDFEVDFIEF